MTPAQRFISLIGIALVTTALGGVLWRGRYRSWTTFAVYLAVVLVFTLLPQIDPEAFHTTGFWQVKETTYTGLRFAMATELAIRTFHAFPGALMTLRRVAFLILLAILVIVVAAPSGEGYTTFVGELQPRVLHGSLWLFTAIAGLILWYRLPVDRFHKAVLLSYVPYLFVTGGINSALGRIGWRPGWKLSSLLYANQLAYVALLVFWNVAIWRRDPVVAAARTPEQAAEEDLHLGA